MPQIPLSCSYLAIKNKSVHTSGSCMRPNKKRMKTESLIWWPQSDAQYEACKQTTARIFATTSI